MKIVPGLPPITAPVTRAAAPTIISFSADRTSWPDCVGAGAAEPGVRRLTALDALNGALGDTGTMVTVWRMVPYVVTGDVLWAGDPDAIATIAATVKYT